MEHHDWVSRMLHILEYWMDGHPSPLWRHLVDALKAPSVDENELAEEIEEKYCVPEEQSPTVSMPKHSGSPSHPPSEGPQKPPFGCGCGKCTFFSFIKKGCPTPIPSASSFPYLDLSGLTHEQQGELKGKLQFESREIMIRFQELVSTTIQSLVARNVSREVLVTHIMGLGMFNCVYEGRTPLHRRSFSLHMASSVPQLFLDLQDFFSFFNYQIIEHIIKALGTEEDKAQLQRYKDDFNQYAKRRIFECPPEFGAVSGADHADIFVKLDSHYDDCTVAEIELFRHKLSEIMCVSSESALRLCRVEKGCIQLLFQVPTFVQEEVFPLSTEQKRTLAAMGVMRLTCGEYQFPVNCVLHCHCKLLEWRAISAW